MTEQDRSKEANQGNLRESGQTSKGKGETSAKKSGTYSAEDLRNAVSNALAEAGRKHKEEMDKINGRLASLQEELENEQLAKIDPNNAEQKSAFQLKKELRKRDTRIEQLESDLEVAKEKGAKWDAHVAQGDVVTRANKIAEGYEDLNVQQMIDLTGGSEEKMKAYAKAHGTPKESSGSEDAEEGIPDGGMTNGGGLKGEKLLDDANTRFSKGEINEKQYRELVSQATK